MHLRLCLVAFTLSRFLSAEALTFDECVREASLNNRDLNAQISVVKTEELKLKASYSNFFPQISGSFSANYTKSQIVASGWSLQPSIAMTQNVFAGYGDIARVDVAKANLEVAKADLAAINARVSSDLKTAFAALLYAQDFQKLSEEIKERRSFNHRLVSLLFEGGRENYGSVLLAKAYIEQADLQILQAKNGLRSSSAALAKMLGRDPVDNLVAKGRIALPPPHENPNFAALALEVPAFKKALAQENVAQAEKVKARAPFFPSIDLNANAGLAAIPGNVNTQWLVGVSISWPFFSGGRDYNGLKSATQSVTTAYLNKTAVLSANTSAITAAYMGYVEAIQQLKVDKAFLTALTIQEKIATQDYNNGFLTFQNWDQFETGYIARQLAILVDERALINAEAAFLLSKGFGVLP